MKRYRRFERLAAACLLSAFAVVMICVELSIKSPYPLIAAGLFWVGLFASIFAASACFKCPACRAPLHRAKGSHCPGCGVSNTLSHETWLQSRRCSSCDLELRYRRKVRKFKMRYCSDCGAHLHELGV
jgi:hypothetical protein